MNPYRKLLLACDGSDGSAVAAAHAAILAKRLGAQLHAIWVRSRLPHYPETIDEVDEEEESAHEFFAKIKRGLDQVATDQRRPGDKPAESSEEDWAKQRFDNALVPQINAAAAAVEINVECGFKLGNTAQLLIAEADAGQFRVVALGHRGSSGIWGRFLGGVADRVSDRANCDVLIVREKER